MTTVFTNGAFDVLHRGHVEYLQFAKNQGDKLIVGINSDESIRNYKGASRPYNRLADRMAVLQALACVDFVIPFYDDEPLELIKKIRPNIIVKGSDWAHYVCGQDFIESYGGRVVLYPVIEGHSSTKLINKLDKNQ